MGFQRDHQLMPVRIIDHLNHQLFSKTVMLHLRRHCQIDHMKSFCCMKLGSPAGIQIIFSLDEFPQFWNILKGDMSLVGPRPERPFFVEKFREEIPRYMVKHQVRPGLTGWAQVNGYRGDTSIKKRIDCDLYYIENWSIGFDIKILFLTIFKGFVNKNAY